MFIEVKGKDDEGNVLFEGHLNRAEVGFMLQYAINDLIHAGVQFNLDQPDNEEVRFSGLSNQKLQ